MATRKIIFTDVDGTLVDYENNLPVSAVAAIKKARENGHLVFVCTGRSKAEMPDYIWNIGFDGMIGGNGTYIEYDDEVIFHQLIGSDVARRLVDWLTERDLPYYLESNNGLFASPDFPTGALDAVRGYCSGKGRTFEGDDATVLFHGMVVGHGDELYRDDLNKVSFVLSSYQDHLDSAAAFPELKAGTWGGAGEKALFGDLGVQDITKGFAVNKVCEALGADVADTIAFGDAKVDIPMFEACGQSCCMGSGGDEAKAAATHVTADVDDEGMAKAFVHFGLIDEVSFDEDI